MFNYLQFNQIPEQKILMLLKTFFSSVKVKFHRSISLLGLFLLFIIVFQCFTGIMLSFSLMSEPMLVPISREEEDMDDLYTDDFYWLHERGVDYIFLLTILHLLRKLFLFSFNKEQESAWKSGSFLFLVLHGVIFFGLVLCCSHLSDITLTIAANIMNTFTFKIGKVYWVLFTDQTLNSDTLVRAMYVHYLLGLYSVYLAFFHSIEMHYDWKDFTMHDFVEFQLNWFETTFKNEVFKLMDFLLVFIIVGFYLYSELEPLNFELFMWGDVGLNTDVRFLGVAPHWYFRAYMSWLLLCPHHYIGVFGLVYLMVVIYFQPNIKTNSIKFLRNYKLIFINPELSYVHFFFFSILFISILYTDSFLPYGRFFNKIGGNIGLTFSYFFIFIYLSTNIYISLFNIFFKLKILK